MKLGVLNFLDDVKNFFHGGRVLGVDLGTVSIKIAEVSRQGRKFKLENYGILETKKYLEDPSAAIQTGSLKISEKETVGLLKALIKEMKSKTKLALFSIPSFSVFVTVLEMPLMNPQETEKAVMFQARQFIPLQMSEVSVDWNKIEEYENDRGGKSQRILLVGVPNELVEIYKKIARGAGLRMVFLELDSFALARAFYNSVNLQPYLTIDIGGEATTASVIEGTALRYSDNVDKGGFYLTQALTRSLGISAPRAEDLKRKKGLLGRGGELELSTLMLGFLDVIIEGVLRARDLYEERYKKKVTRFAVTGGGGNLAGIQQYFADVTKLENYNPQIFADVAYDAKLQPIEKQLQNELAISIGLTKKYFS